MQEAQDLVDQPYQFLQEIRQVPEDKKSDPILERMLRTIQGDAAKQEATSSKERPYYTGDMDDNQFQYGHGNHQGVPLDVSIPNIHPLSGLTTWI